jgi:hypothetical protein
MKIVGFLVLLAGLFLQLWWVVILGWAIYEAGGIAWIAVTTSNGNHHDHGP